MDYMNLGNPVMEYDGNQNRYQPSEFNDEKMGFAKYMKFCLSKLNKRRTGHHPKSFGVHIDL